MCYVFVFLVLCYVVLASDRKGWREAIMGKKGFEEALKEWEGEFDG